MDAMAKQQQKWEKKKDKLDKKRESERGTARKNQKELNRLHKEEMLLRARQEKYGKFLEIVEGKLQRARLMTAAAIIALYLVGLWFLTSSAKAPGEASGPANSSVNGPGDAEVDVGPVGVLTACVFAALSVVFFTGGEAWREMLLRQEQQKAAADAIKDQKDRAQRAKEREERLHQHRMREQQEARERLQRRAQEEASALQYAKEIARAMRLRREQREAEEAARAKAARAPAADQGERDAQGWTARQRQELREAVARYPETWSHSRKQRWETIASEVDGQDARACQAMHARMVEERAATGQKEGQEAAVKSTSVQDDFDWMDADTDDAFTETKFEEENDDNEDEEDEEEGGRQRMAVELEPEHKGTEIRLEGIKSMQGCASVQVELLHLQLACAECKTSTQIHLAGTDEDAADAKTWCEGCSGLMAVHLRPTLLHKGNASRLCYVDCVRCLVTDVLPSVLMSVCESCDEENVLRQEITRNRVVDGTCFKCHSKYAFGFEAIRITAVTPCQMGSSKGGGPKRGKDDGDDPMEEIAEELRYLRKKAKADPRQQLIQPGKALPQMGACGHFKKSFKWYRFACCGRAFPCPQCHVESGCPAAALGAHATRMICGKCSMEQSYSPARPCEKCGFAMQAKFSSSWEGGAGTRNLVAMSAKDAKKFKGGAKQANSKAKTSSAKAARVGAKAKQRREHVRKFGE